ncbi:MAG: ABC transporter permease [Vulcanimicrobiaceae bacterium]
MSASIARPEFVRKVRKEGFGVVARPLPLWERLTGIGALRKGMILAALAAAWQLYALKEHNALLFPTFTATLSAFVHDVANGELITRAGYSLALLLQGYAVGVVLAALLTAFAAATRIGSDLLETLTSMFNPLPSIALLPLALIWFGLGNLSIIFVLVHAVLWSVSLNTYSGFRTVSQTLKMVGRNYGLVGPRLLVSVLIPAALPSILAGLRIGWAFAWRTLIAAELVFGVSSGSGGLGWYIYENKNDLAIANVFAGLFTVIVIGLFVESVIFDRLERHTVRRWGMSN